VVQKRFHFISGLPRSGSTLLSAILNQNPRFHAGVTSPVWSLVGATLPKMGGSSEFASFFDTDRRRAVLRGLFDCYYHDRAEPVIIDTNRTWSSRLPLLLDLFPEAQCICLVRSVPEILESFDRIIRSNPLQVPRGTGIGAGQTVYSRVETMMNSESGVVGLAWSSLRDAWFGEHASRLIVIGYRQLASEPARTMRGLYEALGEQPFAHDFDNIAYAQDEYDASLGMPGLHAVRPRVEAKTHVPTLPPDLVARYAETNFWDRPRPPGHAPVVVI
jgi:sulfotransferase